jgi:hypothetical protein
MIHYLDDIIYSWEDMTYKKYWVIGEVIIALTVQVTILYFICKIIGNLPYFSLLSMMILLFVIVQAPVPFFILRSEIRKAEEEFKNPRIVDKDCSHYDAKDLTYFEKFRALAKTNVEVWFFYGFLFAAYNIINGWIMAQNEPSFQKDKPHIGIILIEYHEFFGKEYLYGFGLDLLINHFRNKTPYAIYPCKTKERFGEIIKDSNVKSIWIFGHGDHGGIRYSATKKILDYKKLVNTLPHDLKKESIYQMHCNSGNCPSLVHLLSDDRGFVNNTTNSMFKTRTFIREILVAEPS